MGLFRLLFWIILIAAAFWLWRRLKKSASTRSAKQPRQAGLMVRCANCGVHVPQDQALQNNDQWFCSQAHLQQGGKPGGN